VARSEVRHRLCYRAGSIPSQQQPQQFRQSQRGADLSWSIRHLCEPDCYWAVAALLAATAQLSTTIVSNLLRPAGSVAEKAKIESESAMVYAKPANFMTRVTAAVKKAPACSIATPSEQGPGTIGKMWSTPGSARA